MFIMAKLVNALFVCFFLFFHLQETLSQLIHLQTAAKKRIAEIKDCEAKIEKAFNYLAKVVIACLMYMAVCLGRCIT